jgi:hypothetical protein
MFLAKPTATSSRAAAALALTSLQSNAPSASTSPPTGADLPILPAIDHALLAQPAALPRLPPIGQLLPPIGQLLPPALIKAVSAPHAPLAPLSRSPSAAPALLPPPRRAESAPDATLMVLAPVHPGTVGRVRSSCTYHRDMKKRCPEDCPYKSRGAEARRGAARVGRRDAAGCQDRAALAVCARRRASASSSVVRSVHRPSKSAAATVAPTH